MTQARIEAVILRGKAPNGPVFLRSLGRTLGRILRNPLATQLSVVLIGLVLWEIAVRDQAISGFLFGSPSGILEKTLRMTASGDIVTHAAYTLLASLAGFVIGTLLGSVPGLLLWYSPYAARVIEPFLVAINSVPKIAFAPLVILWFGTGLLSKVALSVSLTAVVALIAAFQAAKDTDPDLQKMMASIGASRRQIFAKVVVPSAMPHVIATFRINIGFALVGVVVGEFISSQHGIGHVIFVASALYDLNTVWVGILTLMAIGFILYLAIDAIESRLLKWKDNTSAHSLHV